MSVLAFFRRKCTEAEVAIVGGGLPALVVALELARRPKKVCVLGSAGREARPSGLGLAVLGPARPYERVVADLGREQARAVWSAGRENLERLRAFLGEARQGCGYDPRGSFLLAADRPEAESLAESEDLLRDDEFPGEFLDHYMLETHFDLTGFAGAYWAAHGGELDADALRAAVLRAARASGVHFRPARVRAVESGPSGAVVETEEGPIRVSAAVLATDGLVSEWVPDLASLLSAGASGRLGVGVREGARLPTAARTADGRLAWQARRGRLTLAATGPAPETAGGPEAMAARLPIVAGSERRWEEAGDVTADGLPLVGQMPGSRLAVACGFGPLAVCYSFAAARWVADALVGHRDPTPGPLRAAREEPRPGTV